ncbi:MAG: hypothetical protein D6814_03980, partial [Calditrichaeota bacterium]
MKKISKFLLYFLIGAVVLMLVMLPLLLEKVDYTPYFQAAYYQHTRARLDSLQRTTHLSSGPLQAGFGKASITPNLHPAATAGETYAFPHIPLAGYSSRRGAPARSIHDSVFVKAVALRVGETTQVLVSWDALIFPEEIARGVIQALPPALGLSRARVLFSATHSHSSVGGWGEGFLAEQFAGKYNPR